jgi:hypothetical protein
VSCQPSEAGRATKLAASDVTGPHRGPYRAWCEAFDFDADNHIDLVDFAGFQNALPAQR